MSVRNLDHLFQPRSIAVIGASDRERSIGALVMRNLLAAGFTGPVWPVNPRRTEVAGLPAFADVASLPAVPDLAVLCTPALTVPELIDALGAKGTRAAIVLTAGLNGQHTADGRDHLLKLREFHAELLAPGWRHHPTGCSAGGCGAVALTLVLPA